jgi:signal transduction histidine kinase
MGIQLFAKIRPRKRSIMLKWSFANMLFCFFVFTTFVIISYQTSVLYFLGGEREDLVKVMNNVNKELSGVEENLTSENIYHYLGYQEPDVLSTLYDEAGHEIKSGEKVGLLGTEWRYFYVYDVTGQMIFTTQSSNVPLFNKKTTKPVVMTVGDETGYIITREIKSKQTGKVIGYLQAFNELSYHYKIRDKVLLILIILEIVAMFLANIIGYFVSDYFLKPLATLHAAMKKITRSPSGKFDKVVIRSGDEIEELADVFNDMMCKTKDYIEGQERFVSDVSHELRTPLAVLDGHINLLLRWGKDDPEQLQESLQASRQEIQKMSSMIQDMLSISRLRQSDEFKLEKTDVVESIKELISNFQMLHPDCRIELDNQLAPAATAQIYKNHYVQALAILMDNAVKYSGDKEKYIKISFSETKDQIVTAVTDHGMGIGEADQAHVFERFFRADKARNREIGGTGLGLSIIANLAEIYRGAVGVTSEIGKGSTFTLSLPKGKQPTQPS